ncbi:hypothetical protein ISCGN_014148 [Ixodes scapularis]
MVYLRSDWPQHQIDLMRWCTDRQEVVAVRATHQGTPVIIASVYYRPGASSKSPRDNGWIEQLHILYPKERKIIGGDFNLPHTSWGYKVDTINGQKLLEDMTRFKYTLLNTPGSTTRLGLTSRQQHTSPDLTWIYGKTENLSWNVNIDTWGSDHLPIKIEVNSKKSEKNRRFAHTVNWDLYRRHLENNQEESFATAMLDALKAATTRSNIPADAPTPDIHLLNLWARRLRALQRYRRGPKTPAALREVTRHTIAARKHAIYLDRKRWLDYSASLSEKTSVKKLWATSRSMLGQKREQKAPLTLALKTDTSVEDLADAAGDQFFPQPIATTTNSIPNPYTPVLANSADPMDQPFTLGELETALHNGKAHSAPGPDKITILMLRNLPQDAKHQLIEGINAVWEQGQLPPIWKHSTVVPIPKPGKDKDTLINFRPISLTSCVCKLMERMVLDRLNWTLERSGAFHPAQTGFRPCLSTQESLLLMSHDITKKRAPRGKTIRSIVAIDVRKAFDSVPHWAVIQEAERLGIQGRALNFIKAFLKDRTYSIRIGDHMSNPRPNRVGVPQGSVLSPLLFNMAMADLPHRLSRIPSLKFTIYADDISLWTVTGDTRTQQQTLQAGLDEVQTHLNRVGLTASPEKTTYVVVASRKQRKAGIASQMYLTLAGNRIQPSTSIRILGMYIDEDGSCRTWMTKVSQQCKAIIHVIRRICSSRGGANEGIARQMVKALIVSKVCYCASYYNISKSQWKKLETINRQAARVITGLPRFTPIGTLMEHAQLNNLQETVMVRSAAHRERLQHSRPGRTILSLIQALKLPLPDFPENDPPWLDYIDLVEGKPIPKNASLRHPDRQKSQANQTFVPYCAEGTPSTHLRPTAARLWAENEGALNSH